MDAAELVRRTRREYERLNELKNALRASMEPREDTAGEGFLGTLRENFFHFRAHLYKQIALEENGGYMQAILELRPTLAPTIGRLREQHRTLLRTTDEIHHRLEGITSATEFHNERVPEHVNTLLADLHQHEQQETSLLTEAFSRDLGGVD